MPLFSCDHNFFSQTSPTFYCMYTHLRTLTHTYIHTYICTYVHTYSSFQIYSYSQRERKQENQNILIKMYHSITSPPRLIHTLWTYVRQNVFQQCTAIQKKKTSCLRLKESEAKRSVIIGQLFGSEFHC